MLVSNKQITKALIRLRGCAGWSVPVLFANLPKTCFLPSWPILWGHMLLLTNKAVGLANNVDPDEVQHKEVFHLGLQCLPVFTFRSH